MERRPGEGGAVHCGEQPDPTRIRPDLQRKRFAVVVTRGLWKGCDVMVEPATAIHPLRHFRSHGEALLFAGQLASLNGWRLFDRVGGDG
jgi:hypothetical protein